MNRRNFIKLVLTAPFILVKLPSPVVVGRPTGGMVNLYKGNSRV